ncbi:MAG TPA: Hsp20/alpha crystallin family protein [Caldilineae bacterium]|nr:Hsp20/alpha crystallin family protein [Caldilineae bacterium]
MDETFPANVMSLRDAVNELLEQSFIDPYFRERRRERAPQIPIDAWVTDDALVIKANLPGAEPDQVDITIEGDTLTITTEIPRPDPPGRVVALERPHGKMTRTLTLNIPVQVDKVDAVFKNGVLTLTLPKAEQLRRRTIQVRTA